MSKFMAGDIVTVKGWGGLFIVVQAPTIHAMETVDSYLVEMVEESNYKMYEAEDQLTLSNDPIHQAEAVGRRI